MENNKEMIHELTKGRDVLFIPDWIIATSLCLCMLICIILYFALMLPNCNTDNSLSKSEGDPELTSPSLADTKVRGFIFSAVKSGKLLSVSLDQSGKSTDFWLGASMWVSELKKQIHSNSDVRKIVFLNMSKHSNWGDVSLLFRSLESLFRCVGYFGDSPKIEAITSIINEMENAFLEASMLLYEPLKDELKIELARQKIIEVVKVCK